MPDVKRVAAVEVTCECEYVALDLGVAVGLRVGLSPAGDPGVGLDLHEHEVLAYAGVHLVDGHVCDLHAWAPVAGGSGVGWIPASPISSLCASYTAWGVARLAVRESSRSDGPPRSTPIISSWIWSASPVGDIGYAHLDWQDTCTLHFKINRNVIGEMILHALEEDPRECCGVLLGDGDDEATELRQGQERGRGKRAALLDGPVGTGGGGTARRRQAASPSPAFFTRTHSPRRTRPRPTSRTPSIPCGPARSTCWCPWSKRRGPW